jgi:hypothetical protein
VPAVLIAIADVDPAIATREHSGRVEGRVLDRRIFGQLDDGIVGEEPWREPRRVVLDNRDAGAVTDTDGKIITARTVTAPEH